MDFHEETSRLIAKATGRSPADILGMLERPPEGMGDIAFPCFTLAKELKKNPAQIAQDLTEKIKAEYISKTEAKGAYLNITIQDETLTKKVLEQKQTTAIQKRKRTIMLEYPSPNTNKPLHLGHLRNIFIGTSVTKMLQNQGAKVIVSNLNNDRGIHICKSMYAYQQWGREANPDKKTDHFVGDFYVLYEKNKTEETDQAIKIMLQKWESKDKQVISLWKKMNQWALKGFQQTYDRLGVNFNKVYYESEFYDKGKELVKEGLEKGVFRKREDGAIIADLSDKGLGEKVILRADGTSIYVTQDMYLADLKFKEYDLDQSIHVVANEQNRHFEVLFEILKRLGKKYADKCYHLNYGLVNLPEGRMKSREGTVVDADDLIDEIHKLAFQEIQKRHELAESEAHRRAEILSQAALRFFILKNDTSSDMTYDPNESMSFEGETGPYVLYVIARINSITKQARKTKSNSYELLSTAEEQKLVRLLWNYPRTIEAATRQMRPHLICRHLLDISQAFNTFYHEHPVLKAEPELKNARLALISVVKETLTHGLGLLGIQTLDEM